ncbi:uncharacterized protein [Elaeis guineensis]|uniref:uncharacterized protein n=1 Tax=Elaeis guineensis var. tenera TaxID=51953 RepID=UPI003C6D68D5
MEPWVLGVLYASTSSIHRRDAWTQVQAVQALRLDMPFIGDFNCVLQLEDKRGGKPFQMSKDVQELRAFIDQIGLPDLGFQGPSYTWCNNQMGVAHVWERLDWAFASSGWLDSYPESIIFHLLRFASDYCPLLLIVKSHRLSGPRPFRFEKFWLSNFDVHKIVKKARVYSSDQSPYIRLSIRCLKPKRLFKGGIL